MFPRDGDDALYEGFVLLDCLIDSEDGTYVLYDCSCRDGEGATLDLLAKDSVDELLLPPLGVLDL